MIWSALIRTIVAAFPCRGAGPGRPDHRGSLQRLPVGRRSDLADVEARRRGERPGGETWWRRRASAGCASRSRTPLSGRQFFGTKVPEPEPVSADHQRELRRGARRFRRRGNSAMNLRYGLAVMCVLPLVAACDSAPTSPTSVTSSVDLTGVFSGTGYDSFDESAYEMTWELSQSGRQVTGSLRLDFLGLVSATGTVSGTLNGDMLDYQMRSPIGAISNAPTCASTATGTASVSSGVIDGTYSGTNTCYGDYTDGRITLDRQ